MKKIFVILFILTGISAFSQSKIVGKWAGKDKNGLPTEYEFTQDNKVKILPDFPEFTYTVDNDKNPKWIDLVTTVDGTEMKVYGLVEFTSDSEIKLEFFFNHDKHPENFTEEKGEHTDIFILKKQ